MIGYALLGLALVAIAARFVTRNKAAAIKEAAIEAGEALVAPTRQLAHDHGRLPMFFADGVAFPKTELCHSCKMGRRARDERERLRMAAKQKIRTLRTLRIVLLLVAVASVAGGVGLLVS